MKKNIYKMLENTNEKQLEKLTENIEYEIPNDISLENIEKKVFFKTGISKQKKKFSRTLFIRWGAVAACFALILCAYPTIKHLSQDSAEIIKESGESGLIPNSGLGIITQEASFENKEIGEIAWETSLTYRYFFPSEDGSILSATFTEQLNEGRSSETMQSHMDRFFKLCDITGITVVGSTVDDASVTEYEEFQGETIVSHTLGEKTLTLTIEGEAELSETIKKCLINTLDNISYCKYFKVIYNGAYISIDGKVPENGFKRFELNAEETTMGALPGGVFTGALPAETDQTTGSISSPHSSSTEALPPYNPEDIVWETSAAYIPQ